MSREVFHAQLREWFAATAPVDTVGDAKGYKGKPWVWIKHFGNRYHLNADTTYPGVAEYLGLLAEHGEEIRWSVVENVRGARNKVAFGPDQTIISGFYMYRAQVVY